MSFDEKSLPEPRACVRRASVLAQNAELKSWLFMDERGTWEKDARELLALVPEILERRPFYPDGRRIEPADVEHDVALVLVRRGLQAQLDRARKVRSGGRKP